MVTVGEPIGVVHGPLVHVALHRALVSSVLSGGDLHPVAESSHPPHDETVGSGHVAGEGRGVRNYMGYRSDVRSVKVFGKFLDQEKPSVVTVLCTGLVKLNFDYFLE